jgi:hypothetical protein
VEGDVRWSVPGRLVHRERAEVGLDLDARHQLAVGEHDSGDSGSASGALLLIAAQGILGHAGVERDLDPALACSGAWGARVA